MSIYQDIIDKNKTISVIGLGYVGLPIALAFAKKVKVIGFDISENRIKQMQEKIDPSNELPSEAFENSDIKFTANPEDLKEASFHVVAVPTPIDQQKLPDLKPLLAASKTVGEIIKKGDYVVYESTVYPGCTEEDCIPVIEQISGLRFPEDFSVGYSPERINPGDKVHTLENVVKVVSGNSPEAVEEIAKVYELVVKAGVHRAESIKVAEAAKIIENTQRDVNIALINELSIIFEKMKINTYDVLRAAGTKWNFLPFSPGLVGGHCIGVDPYYLTYKAKEYGYHAQIITSGRSVNDSMGIHIADRVVKELISRTQKSDGAKVLIMGTTFKEDVSDIRNSRVVDVYKELTLFGLNVEVTDPYASKEDVKELYGYSLIDKIADNYDAVIVAVNHKEYIEADEDFYKGIMTKEGFIFDVKGQLKDKIKETRYLSL